MAHFQSPFTYRKTFGQIIVALVAAAFVSPASVAFDSEWNTLMVEGESKLKTQQLDAAEECFRKAVNIVRHSKDASPDDEVRCMLSLADVLQTKDNTEEALPLDKKSLRLLEKTHGKLSREVIPALLLLGGVFESEGEYRRAMKFYNRAVVISESLDGPESLTSAESRYRLGRASFYAGDSLMAQTCYDLALAAVMRQSRLPSDVLLANILADYIDLLSKSEPQRSTRLSNFQELLLKDQITSVDRTKGASTWTWDTAVSGKLRPDLRDQKGPRERISSDSLGTQPTASFPAIPAGKESDFASLESLSQQRVTFYERMIATDIDSLGPNHPSVARDLYGLASVYLAANKYQEAKPLLKRALEIYQRVYKSDAQPVRTMQFLLSLIDEEQHALPDLGESGKNYLVGLPSIPLEAQKFEIAVRLNYLALLCYSKDRLEAADKIYAWALATTALACGERSMLVATCLTDYSRLLRSLGRPSEAEKLEGDAHIIMRKLTIKRAALTFPK
jgi:tetratricopeptide (TPR) repeat protein